MPAHINYSITPIIFYKFVCENPEIKSCYVGHTTNFQQRKSSHKSRCHTEQSLKYNLQIYKTIRENGGWNQWKMIEVGRRICLDLPNCLKIEQEYIEELQANLNSRFASRTKKQYSIDNKDIIALKNKKYNSENKEKISERKKIYNIENKDHISKKQKEYSLNNKKHLEAIRNQPFECPCGSHYTHSNRQRHFKSKKHTDYLETINNVDNIHNDASNSEEQKP